MRREDIHPAAIVRSHADTRLAEQRAIAVWKDIRSYDRRTVARMRDLGLELLVIRAARKGADFESCFERIGVSRSTAYEAMNYAENWPIVSAAADRAEARKLMKENLLTKNVEDETVEATPQNGEPETVHENDVSGETDEPVSVSEGTGDAAEGTKAGALLDAEGCVLPESARPAVEGAKAIDKWVEKARGLAKELETLSGTPAGAFIPLAIATQKLRAGWRMVSVHKPDPIYRCNLCQGAGCKKCNKQGWLPKPMLDDHVGKPVQDRGPV